MSSLSDLATGGRGNSVTGAARSGKSPLQPIASQGFLHCISVKLRVKFDL